MNEMTEKQALSKLCHRTLHMGPQGYLVGARCAASQCAAWRWDDNGLEFKRIPVKRIDPVKGFTKDNVEGATPEQQAERHALPGAGWGLIEERIVYQNGRSYGFSADVTVEIWTRANPNRTGFCGLAEPRLADVSVNQ